MLVYFTIWLKTVVTCVRQVKMMKMKEFYSHLFLTDFYELWGMGQDWLDSITPFNEFKEGDDDIMFDAIQSYRNLLKVDYDES